MATIAIGTAKGAWVLRSEDRRRWQVGPHLLHGWDVSAIGPAGDGSVLAATASGWFGPGLHRSRDLEVWEGVDGGPAYPEDGPQLERIWALDRGPDGRLYAGVAQAGVFASDDHGATWTPLTGFTEHPTRDEWQPGGGGLCAHTLLFADGGRMWVGASAVGVFRSDDGGATFEPRNDGIEGAVPGGTPGIGTCVHRIVGDPADPDTLWRQDHTGVYRTTDGAVTWQRIEQGLPGRFGFPLVRDAASGAVRSLSAASGTRNSAPGGRFAAWRSTDGGDSWHLAGTGWPEELTYDAVLRGAMAADGDGGVVLGTTAGQVWATDNAGDTWRRLPGTYPRISTVVVLPDDLG
jgi:hypothetical protein